MNGISDRRLAFIFLVLAILFSACANKALGPVGSGKASPLHEAVRSDNTARVMECVAKGTSIDEADASGMTPLGVAVERQNLEMVKMLVDRGANVRAPVGDEGTALHLAVRGRGPREEPNIEIADLLIASGADLEAIDPNVGFTPLHQAAAWDRVSIAELLLRRGANVDTRPDAPRFSGATPLHIAVDGSRKQGERMVKLLLEHGADVHIRTRFDGATPLHSSLTNRPANENVVRMLLDRGADVNARMSPSIAEYRWSAGNTALHRAVYIQAVKITEILLSRGADVNAKNAKGITPMALARTWEERSRKWDNPDVTMKYRDMINIFKSYGGHE